MSVRFILLSLILLLVTACQSQTLSSQFPINNQAAGKAGSTMSSQPAVPLAVSTPTPRVRMLQTPTPTIEAGLSAAAGKFPQEPLPLAVYPRPPRDNGLGIHWSTHLYAQSDQATAYFVSELTDMNIKWVKLLVDGLTNRDYDETIEALVAADIMPIIRIYQRCNEPYDPDELAALVRHYVDMGVPYFDLYNEPNQPGESGGWCASDGEPQPEYLARVWADAARIIFQAGGYPGLPSFFAPDKKQADWQDDFFYRFFEALRTQGDEEVLYFSWASIHNYNINHPPTYPYDDVNQTGRLLTNDEIVRYKLAVPKVQEINLNRSVAAILRRRLLTDADGRRLSLTPEQVADINRRFTAGDLMGFNLYDDSTAFFHFINYRNQFYDLFGFEIPMISTEGGATKGSAEDPRYPEVDGQTVAEWTLWSADYMLDRAPDYYFATSTWLLAQHALDYDEPVWEVNAWYHDRQGDQEPVVEALKKRPRRAENRLICGSVATNECRAAGETSSPDLSLLAAYPRPPADNGRGLHWSPTNQKLPPEVVDYFIAELKAMNIKWVKFLQDDLPTVTDPYLIDQLVNSGIEPIMRVYKPFNEPYQHLTSLVAEAGTLGAHYFELYNEPNLAGPAGGWREGEAINIELMVDLWILAARDVHAAGGHPSLPPLAGGGTIDDMDFFRQFLDGIRIRDQAHLLPNSWIAVHNYFLNHPLDYPEDPANVDDIPLSRGEIAARELTEEQVKTINRARRMAKLPREQGGFWVGNTIDEDSNAFRKFEAYATIFGDRFGYHIPIIGTEGGAITDANEDPRYPPVREEDVAQLTLEAYHVMLDEAPPYFFAHTPWLMANRAGEHSDERFENAAWYKDRAGTVLDVVEVLKLDPRKDEIRPDQAW